MKKFISSILFVFSLIVFCACGSRSTSNIESIQDNDILSEQSENSETESSNSMSVEEWLTEWNRVYNECYASLPPVEAPPVPFDPDADIMEQAMFQPIADRDIEVQQLISEKYPEVYSYLGKQGYKEALDEQTRKAYEMIADLEAKNAEQKERFLKENQEWLKQFNDNILHAIESINY